ncbi:MAG TPA: hypothetical protein VK196_04915 [Magnetospirillum sp.]|nr:hypothetical protein [Magnetospirillum sp.]
MSAIRITCLAAALGLLAGCNADERAHVVKLDKGTYAGAADTQLSDATRAVLRERAQLQRFGADLHQALRPSEPPPATAVTVDGRMAGQNY